MEEVRSGHDEEPDADLAAPDATAGVWDAQSFAVSFSALAMLAFDEADALQAFIDLARCRPIPATSVRIDRSASGWIGSVPHSGWSRTPRVRIDAEDGTFVRVR